MDRAKLSARCKQQRAARGRRVRTAQRWMCSGKRAVAAVGSGIRTAVRSAAQQHAAQPAGLGSASDLATKSHERLQDAPVTSLAFLAGRFSLRLSAYHVRFVRRHPSRPWQAVCLRAWPLHSSCRRRSASSGAASARVPPYDDSSRRWLRPRGGRLRRWRRPRRRHLARRRLRRLRRLHRRHRRRNRPDHRRQPWAAAAAAAAAACALPPPQPPSRLPPLPSL